MTEELRAAIDLVDKVCAEYVGNRKDHVMMQSAVEMIRTALTPKPKKPRKKKEKKTEV
jgi:hypothetical protein